MEQCTAERIEKAKKAHSAQELVDLAKHENIDLTLEQATEYIKVLHPSTHELADDDLDNVAGGACYKGDGRLIVTLTHTCEYWKCKNCGGKIFYRWKLRDGKARVKELSCNRCSELDIDCNHCAYMSYEKAMWLCNHPFNKK